MKPAHAFWLMLIALAFIALQSLVSLPDAMVLIIDVVLAAMAMYASFASAMRTTHRALLIITGLGLLLPHLLTWMQVAAGWPLLAGDIWASLRILRSSIVGVALIVFGFNATWRLSHRLIIAAIGFAWSGFITLGPQALTDLRQVVYLFLMVLVVGVSYWANGYLNQGKNVQR